MFELIEWVDGQDTEVFVVDLKTGGVSNFTTDPFYSVHHANAYRGSKVGTWHGVKKGCVILLFLCACSFF